MDLKELIERDGNRISYRLNHDRLEFFLKSQDKNIQRGGLDYDFIRKHANKQVESINEAISQLVPDQNPERGDKICALIDNTLDTNAKNYMTDVNRCWNFLKDNSTQDQHKIFMDYLNGDRSNRIDQLPPIYFNYTRTSCLLENLKKTYATVKESDKDEFLSLITSLKDIVNQPDPYSTAPMTLLKTYQAYKDRFPREIGRFARLTKRMSRHIDKGLWEALLAVEKEAAGKYESFDDAMRASYSIGNILALGSKEFFSSSILAPRTYNCYLPHSNQIDAEPLIRQLPEKGRLGALIRYKNVVRDIAKINPEVAQKFLRSSMEYLQKNDLSDVIGEIEFKGKYMKSKTFSVIPFDNSELWYAFAESIINAETSDTYVEQYEREISLIDSNLGDIFKKVGPYINYVDLGPGDGFKTAVIAKRLKELKQSDTFGYSSTKVGLVDILEDITKIAKDNITRQTGYMDISSIISDFSALHFNDSFNEFRKNSSYSRILYSLLGTTFCNFEPEEICGIMHNVMEDTDYMILGVQLYPKGNEANYREMMDSYKSDEIRKLSYDPLRMVGFSDTFKDKELKYVVDFKDSSDSYACITTHFEVAAENGIDTKVRHYNKGDIIPILKSYKYRPDEFEGLLKKQNFSIEHSEVRDNLGLYLVKKSGPRPQENCHFADNKNTKPLFALLMSLCASNTPLLLPMYNALAKNDEQDSD